MKKGIASGITAGTLLTSASALPACQAAPEVAPDAHAASEGHHTTEASKAGLPFAQARTANLWVKGLACPYCVQNVQKQIAGIEGVERVHVDLPTGQVQIQLAADHPATKEQLVRAIGDSGFTLDRIEMP
ncbi:MAG TPA: copper chaperone [Phycisphaerales bacterium]|nr:copper chaperone [Phycisphaerales bacterium]